jgi:hypothetical protein
MNKLIQTTKLKNFSHPFLTGLKSAGSYNFSQFTHRFQAFSSGKFGCDTKEPYVCEAGQMVGLWHYLTHQKSTTQ